MQLLNKHHIYFPHPELADEDGLLAVGGDLDVRRLILAYNFGIFPWYSDGQPILWWCPDPRYVLRPSDVRVTKSMRNILNRNRFRVSLDKCFTDVIQACQLIKRQGQRGTWITDEMKDAYIALHEMGLAHSVEVWEEDELVGGLYGISIGKIFFGESMFSKVPNASKFAFIQLCRWLETKEFILIDCQIPNDHLTRLGASYMDRKDFLSILRYNRTIKKDPEKWTFRI